MKRAFCLIACSMVIVVVLCHAALAQSTEFTYQGRLLSGALPANGSHDFDFSLFDAITAGNQIGSTASLTAVNSADGSKVVAAVSGGPIYTATLTAGSTTVGTAGSLVGGNLAAIELLYIGNGKFFILSQEGAITSF
jgi:hypothetical protein